MALSFPQLLNWDQYLAHERHAPERSEMVGGVLHAMAGAMPAHSRAVANLLVAIHPHARAHGCEAFVADQIIRTAALTGRYPDVGVYSDEAGENQRWRERPCLLVEVVSADSSAGRDRVTKRGEYLAMPSVLAHLIVDPETRLIEVVQRVTPDSDWTRWLAGLDDTIILTCPPMTLNVSDVFA